MPDTWGYPWEPVKMIFEPGKRKNNIYIYTLVEATPPRATSMWDFTLNNETWGTEFWAQSICAMIWQAQKLRRCFEKLRACQRNKFYGLQAQSLSNLKFYDLTSSELVKSQILWFDKLRARVLMLLLLRRFKRFQSFSTIFPHFLCPSLLRPWSSVSE